MMSVCEPIPGNTQYSTYIVRVDCLSSSKVGYINYFECTTRSIRCPTWCCMWFMDCGESRDFEETYMPSTWPRRFGIRPKCQLHDQQVLLMQHMLTIMSEIHNISLLVLGYLPTTLDKRCLVAQGVFADLAHREPGRSLVRGATIV